MRVEEKILAWWNNKLEWLWNRLEKPFKDLISYLIALARLVIWTILVFFSGLQRTLFMRSEVVGVELKVTSLRSDLKDTDDKLAYIDKLCLENPELMEVVEDDFYGNDFPDDSGDGENL